jgi:hypothetical protein
MNEQEKQRLQIGNVLRYQTRGGDNIKYFLVTEVNKHSTGAYGADSVCVVHVSYIWQGEMHSAALQDEGPEWSFIAEKRILDWCKRIA